MVARLDQGVPLSRLTTIGTGGPAAAAARPQTIADLEDVLRQAVAHGLPVMPIGLGSNVLAADTGVRALVVRLEGDLARIDVRGETLVAGGGASNAVCLHAARAAGLGGFEFACAIPGTAGGGVRMNAGAYGSDWSAIVERALIVTAEGSGWVLPPDLGLRYRASALLPGQVVALVEYRLERSPESAIRARVTELTRARKASQPTNRRTFGSVFKNPAGDLGAGALLDGCGLRGHRIGGAVISPRHANFIENAGGATSADCLALMREGARRVREHYGLQLEHEVVLLGLELDVEGIE